MVIFQMTNNLLKTVHFQVSRHHSIVYLELINVLLGKWFSEEVPFIKSIRLKISKKKKKYSFMLQKQFSS